ncbi:MAG: amidohydrolase family protein [Rhodospirillales bacterium]
MDLVIRDATIYDGKGGTPYQGDVAVKDGRIAAVGTVADKGTEEIDAGGLALMPGIIDSHTHFDAQITWDPWCTPSPALGVTSVLIGNCGFTIAPCKEPDRDLIMKNLVQVEGMSLDVLRGGIDWGFESFPEYLDMLEARGAALNVGAFLGHSSIRTYVMGDAATERAANDDEIKEMADIVRAGMQAGAVGFATSTAPQHNGWGGVPMPSRLADAKELETLVSVMGEDGRGVFMLTKGNTTDVPYLETVAAKSGRPVMIAALLHNPTNPEGTFKDLAAVADARANGRELWGQVSCCPLYMDFSLKSAYPLEGLAAWKPAMEASGEALKAVYASGAFRQAVKDELAGEAGVRLFNGEWNKIEVTETAKPENKAYDQKKVQDLAEAAGMHPLDWMLDLAISEDLETLFMAELLNTDEDAVGRMMRDPNASVALSDAGAHLTFFCDAGFGLHLMGHWSRDLGKLTLEEATHELTAKPAAIYRIPERGEIKQGYHADLLLFDPATVGRGAKQRVFDLPGGAPRLTTDAVGVHGVWVNGTKVADANGPIGNDAGNNHNLPGRVLRSFGT